MAICANGRFRVHKVTGVQRYAEEITRRLSSHLRICQPQRFRRGWRGHFWEQALLPLYSYGDVLWSPCAAGPILAQHHVVTFHDLFPVDSPEWYRKSYAVWYRMLLSTLARTAQHIIAVSYFTKERIVERFGVNAAKITVIHNGVDHEVFRPTHPDRVKAAGTALNLPTSRYLLCVGSLEPRKNLKRLLAAWSALLNELPSDLWLVVAGSKDPQVYRSAGIKELPERVFLAGYVPDCYLSGLYSGSIGFLYPSLGEGFGLPPLEAMACGVPVLTSRISSLPEVCSGAALYVDPTDMDELVRALRVLVKDASRCSILSAVGRERAREFTWDRASAETLRVLQRVALSGPGISQLRQHSEPLP